MSNQATKRVRNDLARPSAGLVFRPIVRNDISALASLYERCFDDRPSERHMLWRYFETQAGAAQGIAGFDNDTCVASFMVWPQRVRVNGKEYKTAQGCDAMVHPDYRGQGLFATTGEKLAQYLKQCGYKLFFVLPNDHSLRVGTRHINWHHVCDIPRWVRPLWVLGDSRISGMAAVTSLLWSANVTSGLRMESRAPNPMMVADLSERLIENDDFCRITRDQEWFSWRYHADSDKGYQWVAAYDGAHLKGLAVWRFHPDLQRAYLCELIGDTQSVPAVLNAVLRAACRKKARVLDFPTNDPALVQHLKANGFIRRHGLHFVVRALDDSIPSEVIQFADAWRLYGGDIDYY